MSVYDRQEDLGLNIPGEVCVIGLGGVGSWVALDLALLGARKVILVDPDVVEENNLNRTPFAFFQVGMPKVEAVAQLITERRKFVEVEVYQDLFDDVPREAVDSADLFVDCRDISTPLPKEVVEKEVMIGGYDGDGITLHYKPSYKGIWGESHGYTVTPSWVAPPQLIATLVTVAVSRGVDGVKEDTAVSFKIGDLLSTILKGKI